MPLHARTLLGPGPSNPYPEATVALGEPLLGHLDPVFLGILDETSDRLRQVFGTANRRTLPLSATGSAGMEAAFVNTVGPGDVVVVAVNGLFGAADGRRRLAVRRRGRRGRRTSGASRSTPQRVLDAHPSPKLIAAVHAETSTGVLSDLAPLAAGKGDALLLADCVTSLGGIPVRARRLGRRPRLLGLAEVPRRRARAWPRSPSTTARGSGGSRSRRAGTSTSACSAGTPARRPARAAGRTTTPRRPGMVVSLHAGLGRILEEGLDAVHARHAEAGRLLHDGLQAMGLELFAAEGHRLPELTTVRVPEASTRRRSARSCWSATTSRSAAAWAPTRPPSGGSA